jgi:hypothetical protein
MSCFGIRFKCLICSRLLLSGACVSPAKPIEGYHYPKARAVVDLSMGKKSSKILGLTRATGYGIQASTGVS